MYLSHGFDLSGSRDMTDVISHVLILSAVCGFLYPSCSIDTNPLSWAVCQILDLKHIWTFRVTWRHRSRDHSIGHGHGPFAIGVPLVLTLYLQRIECQHDDDDDDEILRLKCIWLTFLDHVTSSVT